MPRFVLLEHHGHGVHWDLMLEAGGALRTWAIDTPVVFGADLPARALPDHRLAYLDYEGAISGGRGWVRRVDQGTYEAQLWYDDRVLVTLAGRQLVGAAALRRTDDGRVPPRTWVFRLKNFD
jgi:hypothetical protein